MKKIYLILSVAFLLVSCVEATQQVSDSGVRKASVKVRTDENGQTVEQENIIKRLQRDNSLGSVKHLYVISSYSGDVMEYSTVKGKVTSGGKRLSPKTIDAWNSAQSSNATGFNTVIIGSKSYYTDEVLDDGGTYGESGNYLFWFDAQDNYHQYYPSGGTYLHISEKPLRIRKANLTLTVD